MSRNRRLLGFAALAGGAVAGAILEDVLYRRLASGPDPEKEEPVGGIPGTTSWVEAGDGTALYTRSFGSKDAPRTIVFAHGITENHIIWHYLVRELRADGRYRLVCYDARGHGNSGPAKGPDGTTPFNGDTLGNDLATVVDQATDGPVLLVGHSLGGMTALTQLILDRKERERVAGAVIVNSTFTSDVRGWRGRGKRRMDRVLDATKDLIEREQQRLARLRMSSNDLTFFLSRTLFGKNPSPRHIALAFHMYETTPVQTLVAAMDLLTFDVGEDLPRVDVPVLVVTGTRDVLTPQFVSRDMTEHIPNAELVVFEGCGHMAPFERYEELTAHIQKFADKVFS